ncbi:hypothetical protein JCM14719A_15640 [Calditerricola satsumensis]
MDAKPAPSGGCLRPRTAKRSPSAAERRPAGANRPPGLEGAKKRKAADVSAAFLVSAVRVRSSLSVGRIDLRLQRGQHVLLFLGA